MMRNSAAAAERNCQNKYHSPSVWIPAIR